MLDIKKLIAKILNWSGFKYIWDTNTNNTTDTWVPVLRSANIQHRVLSRNQNSNLSYFAKSQSVTVAGNATAEIVISISSETSGYNGYALLYANNSSTSLIVTNYWTASDGIHVIFWNRTSSSKTGNAQIAVLRWKTDA